MKGLASFALAGLELRRFLRGRLTAAALAVLAVIPLLYGALYLYAFWDPYGRLNHIPAALVIEDQPAKAQDGTQVHAGKDLADELIKRQIFDWHVTTESGAEKGLKDGKYQLLLRIPADFSADLVTAPDGQVTPEAAQLTAVSDDATNYLSGVFSRTAFDEVRAAASASASSNYYDKMLIGFTDLKSQTQKAAAGASKLAGGAKTAKNGADQLATGADKLQSGAGTLANGLGTAGQGADQLVDGIARINSATGQLATGAQQAAAGTQQLATLVDGAADKIVPLLKANAKSIQDGANLVANGADLLAANVGAIQTASDKALTDATNLRDYVDGLPADTPHLAELKTLANRLVTDATTIHQQIAKIDLNGLRQQLRTVAATARQVAAAAPHLADELNTGRKQVDALNTGVHRIASGLKQVHAGAGTEESGLVDLRGGIYRLQSGARQIDGGAAQLASGSHQLADGLGDLLGGADQLASGLSSGANQIPSYGDNPKNRANILADPVALDRSVEHPASTYGVGFAPYFIALALWVGAMVTYMVLKPLNRRYLMSAAPTHRVTFAGLLPAVAIGFVQATLLFAVVRLALGLDPVHPFVTWGLMALAAAVFATIMQLLNAALGPAGRIAALALLMLQLTSSGGTYPVQTSPAFFQVIHPLLPMTYVVESMRQAIDGGSAGLVVRSGAVLVAYASGALILTLVVARRQRRLRAGDLHPELVL